MNRRRKFLERHLDRLLGALRLVMYLLVAVAGYFGLNYIFEKSRLEIEAITNRPDMDIYLDSRDVAMKVIDDEGKLSMTIRNARISLSADQKTATFTPASGKDKIEAIFLEDGEVSLLMEAGNIEYDTESEDFILTDGLRIETSDGMVVETEKVEWRRVKDPGKTRGIKDPNFRFPLGVHIYNRDGNELTADYMQADKDLLYMQMVGNVRGVVRKMEDTEFISGRGLADVDELYLDDFETLTFLAEKVIYDKRNEVILATSRFYDREFVIRDMDGRVVRIEDYQDTIVPVTFAKKEITIRADHIEAHIKEQWMECFGHVDMVIPAAEPEEGDDKSLLSVKQFDTRVAAEDLEYFWGRDYILTHGPTRVEQEDRLAMADQIIYWGAEKQVLLDGNITIIQGSGQWLFDDELVSLQDHDMRRMVSSYTEVYANRAVIYLNNNDVIASGDVFFRQDEREVAAETIVYQDDIKRISAKGNVRFVDKDGQALIANSLVFHNDSNFMEIRGGMAATLSIPAKYANDVNTTLSNLREIDAPASIEDPAISAEPPSRNPNVISGTAQNIQPIRVESTASHLPVLKIPGISASGTERVKQAQEIVLELGKLGEQEPSPKDPGEEPEKQEPGEGGAE